jgi:peptidoglycan/xylan/chitin deacetylase (PgdA/CDA1 family)
MNRRQLLKALAAACVGVGARYRSRFYGDSGPRVAITIDDFNWPSHRGLTADERNQALLDALAGPSIKAGLFVCGKNVEDANGKALLAAWDSSGHLIGNHTYLHNPLTGVSLDAFSADVLRCQSVIGQYHGFKRFFRFPMLKEGDTIAKRDGMRAFLKEHGYRTGHVTIDTSDWYIDERLGKRLDSDPKADLEPYRKYYLDHIWDRAVYYDSLSRKVLGRSVNHTVLLHHSLLNGLFLKDLLAMFESKGWTLIDAEDAFTDPVFSSEPKILPAGESLIWALAKESGKFNQLLRYPGEDGDYEKERMDKLNL